MGFTVMLVGLAAGVLSGLLGVGGGIVLVPAMTLLAGIDIRVAIGTSLWVIIPTALFGGLNHLRLGSVDMRMVFWLAMASALGAVVGSQLSSVVPVGVLKKGFGVILIATAIRMFQ